MSAVSLELFIALRYLRARRKGPFAAVTSGIGVAGVALGVAALLTTLSVMNGFQTDIQKKIVGAHSHLTVYGSLGPRGQAEVERVLAADPAVEAFAPFILGQAIVTRGGRSIGVVLKGLEPAREFKVNDLARSLRRGDWSGIESPGKTGGIVLGEELALNLGADLGSEVVLVSPKSVTGALGLLPKMQRFRVVGTLHTGYYEYDATTAYASLDSAARFFSMEDGATGIGTRLKDIGQTDAAARRVQEALGGGHVVRTFKQMNRTLFAALKLEKAVMFLLLALIILVASLTITSNLILLGIDKTRDIGILRAQGATPGQVRRVFQLLGLLIGGTGVLGGTALGLLLCWLIRTCPIVELPPDIYYLSRVPVDVHARDVAAVMLSGLALSLLATLYPASRAARVDPVEAIHYG